jgi:hypothetical protein
MTGVLDVNANATIDRACEIFRDARNSLGSDLAGMGVVDLLADGSGWSLDECRELAAIVVDRCECSERIRQSCRRDPLTTRTEELSAVAYHGYCVSVSHRAFDGSDLPAWDDLPDRIKRGWRGSVVDTLLDFQDGEINRLDPGETLMNSEHHFAAGKTGISCRMVIPKTDPETKLLIERDSHSPIGVERIELNQAEARELVNYLNRTFAQGIWRE